MANEEPGILFVDDEDYNRLVFEQSYKDRYRVYVAGSGEEALAILRSTPNIGVILSDQRMPGMSGNELLETVKVEFPLIVRLVVTAFGELDPILRAVNLGLVARYMVKPWTGEELDELIAWAVDAYRLGCANASTQARLLRAERLMTIGSINAAVLHDLNQPLSYLITNTERLMQLGGAITALRRLLDDPGVSMPMRERTALNELAEEYGDIIEDMMQGCRHLNMLTRTVRGMLHPEDDVDREPGKLKPAIKFAMSVCQQSAMQTQTWLSYDGPDELPDVTMSSTSLTQVLLNLMLNATQAVSKTATPGRVILRVKVRGASIVLQVEDNGPGMSAEVLQKLGTAFFTTKSEGTGLGINQCKRLVEGVGGTIDFESREGGGTLVSVTLPRSI